MINFFSETKFKLKNKNTLIQWIQRVIITEGKELGEINFIFCDDEYLLKLNEKYLDHDTLTDIITFDNNVGYRISGDIYISVERVKENSKIYKTTFSKELHRVMIHGVLHLCGYGDKSHMESITMRSKEDEALEKLNQV